MKRGTLPETRLIACDGHDAPSEEHFIEIAALLGLERTKSTIYFGYESRRVSRALRGPDGLILIFGGRKSTAVHPFNFKRRQPK